MAQNSAADNTFAQAGGREEKRMVQLVLVNKADILFKFIGY